jgi:type II restriction enzyme
MELILPLEVAKNYSSPSQQIRVMTEYWVGNLIFCPNCGNHLSEFENNTPVADFYCKDCQEEYELKSKGGTLGKKIVDGAYGTMLERLSSNNNPNFFLLTYDRETFRVKDFLTVPKYFFVENIIEKRKPLGSTARRAGWVGCNIVINNIPEFGKIFYVKNGVKKSKDEVLSKWSKTNFVKTTSDLDAKGWLFDVSLCIDQLKKREFSLDDVYVFEPVLKAKHPANNNVKAKIRQQLQFLRDKGILEFKGSGQYKLKEE